MPRLRSIVARWLPLAGVAAALGLRLGGPSRYGDRDEVRPFLGDGPAPTVADIARARRLARDVDLLLAALLVTSRLGSE